MDMAIKQDITLEELIRRHKRFRPCLMIQDVYKLVYQSVFGVGHILVGDEARTYIKEELQRLDTSRFEDEPLIEHISTDNQIVRVNLRPFKRQGLSPDKLFQIMTTSAEQIKGTREDFLREWDLFKKLVVTNRLSFNLDQLRDFDEFVKKQNYPLVHHSKEYSKMYEPAYRVVKLDVYQGIFNYV